MKATGLFTIVPCYGEGVLHFREWCYVVSTVKGAVLPSRGVPCVLTKSQPWEGLITLSSIPLGHRLKRNMAKICSASPGRSHVDSLRSSRCHVSFSFPCWLILPGAPITSADRTSQRCKVCWGKTNFNSFFSPLFSIVKNRKIEKWKNRKKVKMSYEATTHY